MDTSFIIEAVFFVFGILPWWYIAFVRHKHLPYWVIYVYVCVVWLPYYSFVHFAPMGILNNMVELGIACYGLYRFQSGEKLSLTASEKCSRL